MGTGLDVSALEKRLGEKKDATVIVDRGMANDENLSTIRKAGITGWWPLGNQNESAILRWPVASQAKDEAVRVAEEEAIEAATKNGAIKAKR
jgi:hypothetical protein